MALPPTAGIIWGTGFANTWRFFGAPDNPKSLPVARGFAHESEAGNRDFFSTRDDFELTIEAIAIPSSTVGGVTGWNDANGVQDALLWMQKQNVFRFVPDMGDTGTFYSCQLIDFDPGRDIMWERGGARRRVRLRMRNAAASKFTDY